ncbi:MAG: hypothetical protein MRY78_15920 [Saprospiraceae bacterium]|nr:hypothetical protein [Saprospiraceae bacterium]
MNPILRNVLAVVAGIVIGSIVNMALIMIGNIVFPLPESIDPMDPESLKAGMALLEPKNFVFPFLAHALGTLVGATVAALIATGNILRPALVVAAFFLLGGIVNVVTLGGPMWFNALDLVVAYLPMAWLGIRIADRKNTNA